MFSIELLIFLVSASRPAPSQEFATEVSPSPLEVVFLFSTPKKQNTNQLIDSGLRHCKFLLFFGTFFLRFSLPIALYEDIHFLDLPSFRVMSELPFFSCSTPGQQQCPFFLYSLLYSRFLSNDFIPP